MTSLPFRPLLSAGLLVALTACQLPAGTGKLEGQVSFAGGDAATVVLSLTGPATGAGRPALDGRFAFSGLAAGTYVLSAEAPSTKEGRVWAGVDVKDAATSSAGTLTLTPAGSLAGRVVLPTGEPAAGVVVYVPGEAALTTTNAEGRYRLDRLGVGPHDVWAAASGYATGRLDGATVRYREEAAAPDLQLTLADTGRGALAGRVSVTGAPDGAGVSVVAVGPTGRATTTAPDGTWRLDGLTAGRWVVTFTAADTVEHDLTRLVDVADRKVDVADVVFTASGDVEGTVSLDGAPVAGALVSAPGTAALALSDAGGRYVLTGLPAGARIVASQTARGSGTTTATVVRGERTTAALALAPFAAPPGGLAGRALVDGGGAAAGIVVSACGTGCRTQVTDDQGRYAFSGLEDWTWSVTLADPLSVERVRVLAVAVAGAVAPVPDVTFVETGVVR
ncbi:MAG: hypothetical protein RL199_539, partial [Pseudomonadota bacterium]